MPILNSNLPAAFLPEDLGALVLQAIRDESRTSLVATVDTTKGETKRYPILSTDADVTWLEEAEEYSKTAPGFAEFVVTPSKVGGMVLTSEESFADSDAPEQIAGSLAASIAAKIDRAFFTTVAAPAPQGLSTATGMAEVNAAEAPNLDFVVDAIAAIESAGGTAGSLAVSPAIAAYLAKMKTATGSNAALLGTDPTVATRRIAAGLPIVPVRDLPDTIGYVIDPAAVRVVYREDTKIAVSTDAYFSTGMIATRAYSRVGFGLLLPARIARVSFAADLV